MLILWYHRFIFTYVRTNVHTYIHMHYPMHAYSNPNNISVNGYTRRYVEGLREIMRGIETHRENDKDILR